MKTPEASRALAESLVAIGSAAGVRTEALITRMDAPLGRAVGNAIEVIESIETLKGRGPADLEELSVLLAARMLVVAGVARDEADAEARVREAIALGRGRREAPADHRAPGRRPARRRRLRASAVGAGRRDRDRAARRASWPALEAEHVGRAAVALGAGRGRLDDVDRPRRRD